MMSEVFENHLEHQLGQIREAGLWKEERQIRSPQ
jgi:hypothetical protein